MINGEDNEHDMTKQMLSTIRESVNAISGNEEIGNEEIGDEESGDEESVSNDDDSVTLDSNELKTELTKIREAVGARMTFTEDAVILYPKVGNIILRGEFDEGLVFEMSKTDGLYVTASSLQINNSEIVAMLKKLEGYYDVWVGEWAEKITDYEKDM